MNHESVSQEPASRWSDPALPIFLLVLAMIGAAVLTFAATEGHNLYADEVQILSEYQGWDPGTLLKAAGGHLILTTLLIYKAIYSVFGADSYLPHRILHVFFALLSGGLFFLLTRKRVGDLAALAPTVILLFLGSGDEIVATPFGVLGYVGIACGLAMFLALEREDRTGDILASVFLLAGLASYSINVAFGVGAAVWIWQRGPERRRSSAWVLVVPVVLYGIWRLTELEPGETNLSADNLTELPAALVTSLAAACAAITGLFRLPSPRGPEQTLAWGYPLAAILVAAIVIRLRAQPPVDRRFWVWLAALLSFWGLVALNLGPLREPEASRYQYVAAVLLLLLIVELVAGLRLPRWAAPAIAVMTVMSVLANAVALHKAGDQYRIAGENISAQLAAVEVARDRADPNAAILALPDIPVVQDLMIPVRDYLEATDDVGSPAFSESELEKSPELARAAADGQLVRLLGPTTVPVPALPPNCTPLTPTPTAAGLSAVVLPPGGMYLHAAAGPPVALALQRFADISAIPMRGVAGGASAALPIPPDRSREPWTALISAQQPVELCAA